MTGGFVVAQLLNVALYLACLYLGYWLVREIEPSRWIPGRKPLAAALLTLLPAGLFYGVGSAVLDRLDSLFNIGEARFDAGQLAFNIVLGLIMVGGLALVYYRFAQPGAAVWPTVSALGVRAIQGSGQYTSGATGAAPVLTASAVTCPQCATPNAQGSLFCFSCGASLAEGVTSETSSVKCPQCAAPNAQDSLFCLSCGARLSEEATAQT